MFEDWGEAAQELYAMGREAVGEYAENAIEMVQTGAEAVQRDASFFLGMGEDDAIEMVPPAAPDVAPEIPEGTFAELPTQRRWTPREEE